MEWLKDLLLIVVALQHLGFLYLEMFLWTKPVGLKIFRMTAEQAKQSEVLAANQGLYNGFLSLGLLWAAVHTNPIFAKQLSLFFLGCVLIAALYGGYSVSKRILLIQGLPASIALLVVAFL